MNELTKIAFSAGLVLVGMLGLHRKIEYSGWVLAVGLIIAMSA